MNFNSFMKIYGAEMNTAHGGLWGGRKKKQGAPIERDLFLDLEDLFHGCAKKIKISRKVMNEDGHTSSIRDTILTVNVKPGWTEGTKIIFSHVPADIVFVVRQKSHPRFERQNNDLIYTVHTSLKKVRCCSLKQPVKPIINASVSNEA
uniref:Chaperone DnaJ C-terminal domain-containing protein n=1 Tax=Denticeps clupeoides TaxID=299321 RepID=A0AAY4BT39_9TELE